MPAGELHLQLSVNFADNRKVRALVRYGRDIRAIRDLYIQMCLYCKGNLSDGFVPDEQIGLLVYPDTEKNGKRDATRLAEVGLIERGVGGWLVTGWFDRNSSREEIKQKSAAKARGAKLANHRRWHVEYGNTDPKCEWCQTDSHKPDQTTDQNTDPSRDQTSDPAHDTERVASAKRSDSTETESETESEKEVKALDRQKPAGRRIEPGSDDDPDFTAFWSAYPRKEAKGQARVAWRTAVIRRKTDPKVIILGAERYADDPQRKAGGRKYTAHPATWLNGERWLEQSDDTRNDGPEDDDEDFWSA